MSYPNIVFVVKKVNIALRIYVMQYTALAVANCLSNRFQARGFVIIAKKLALNLFLSIRPLLFSFRYVIDKNDIYACMSLF